MASAPRDGALRKLGRRSRRLRGRVARRSVPGGGLGAEGEGGRNAMKIERVGVVGCGLMGSGIAQVAAGAGLATVVIEVDEGRLKDGVARIDSFLEKGVERGKLTPGQKKEILSRLEPTTRLEKLSDVDVVIEAVVEDLAVKKNLFGKLDAILKREAIRCSNTSSLCITEMAAATRHPQRFVGLHFFNPVPLMKVVEIIPALTTDPKATEAVQGLA